MSSIAKAIIKSSVEKFLKKEIDTPNHTEDKLAKMKSALRYIPDDDCFCIVDPECSIKCVFEENSFNAAIEKKGGNKENLDNQLVHIKKSHLDVLFTLDINNNYFLKVVVFIEEFDLENTFNSNKDLPDNVNLFADIQKLLKGVHDVYLKRRKAEAKLTDNDKIQASSAYNKKFETTEELQSFLAFRDSRNFLLRKRIPIDNFYSYINDDKPTNLSIIKALRNLDAKKLILKQNNYKKNKAKELKPTNIDLSKIPTNQYEEEDVEEEYKPFLKPTSLTNPVSTLDKDTFLKHRRRRSAIAKPSKVPASILALYTEYQNVFANVKLSSLNKYSHMKLFKETISNDL